MTESKICTCPSGDGSLRWPCPKHPAVEHERAEFEAWVRRDWPGAPLRFIRDALPVNDPRYGQYCDDALQRAWVGWQARAALAQPSPASDLDPFNLAPHAEAFNEAPDEALKPEQAEAERPEVVGSLYLGCWADQEELEDNDVELDMKVVERLQVDLASKGDGVHMPLMTVAQHERIVGELRTEIAMLRSYESEWELLLNQHEQERDSALAEVERLRQFERICEGLPQDAIDGCWTVQGIRGYAKLLEDQLKSALARVAELEKQEPVATVAKVPGEDWNGLHFYRDLQGMLPGTKLYTTPVAQAQHSVPDGYRLIRLEHFAAIKAQLNPEQVDAYRGRNIYDEDKVYANWNACRSALDEIKDVFQQIDWDAENELAELLAAAPGNSAQHSVPEGWMLVECGIWTQEQVDEMQKTVARFRNSEFVDDRALAMAVADAGQCKAPEISLAELLAAATGKEGL